MRRRTFIALIGAASVWPFGSFAEESGRLKQIGFLRLGPPPTAWVDALRHGLRDLGYVEGRNIDIEFLLAPDVAQVPSAAAELARLKVEVIFASGTPALLAARDAALGIPVVFVAAIDPVATGVVTSLARPGGDITGFTNTQADITGKHLQFLTELLPTLSRVVVLVRANSPANARYIQEAEAAAKSLAVEVSVASLRSAQELEPVFMAARGASAIVMTDDAMFTANRNRIAELAVLNRLPVISSTREFVRAGGLISYGPDTIDLYRRAAGYVARILSGTKPADLPVQQPTRFQLAINLSTAKALGLAVPPMLLARADEVVE